VEFGRKVDIPGFLYKDARIVSPDQTFYLCFSEHKRKVHVWINLAVI